MKTIVNQDIAEKVAATLLKIKAVSINTKKPFRYVSGILAPLYTDNRLLISHVPEWSVVIDAYVSVIEKQFKNAQVFSGTATAAIPHAAVLAYKTGIPMVYVRTSKKEHGKENLIEGEFTSGSKVLIIEDLVSTAKSITQNVESIRRAGGIVTDCLAITTSTLSAFEETVKNLNITLHTLTDIGTIIKVAHQEGYVSKAEEESIQTFLKDPKSWGHKMGFE